MFILAGIVSLRQHLSTLKNDFVRYMPDQCPHCSKSNLWRHGDYPRKADRNPGSNLNPVPIPRFYCPDCRRTCSTLPECLPPRRWYPWLIQQAVVALLLSSASLKAAAKQIRASRSTVRRWWGRLKARFHQHRQVLVSRYADLGRTAGFVHFWKVCLERIPLSSVMRKVSQSGYEIP